MQRRGRCAETVHFRDCYKGTQIGQVEIHAHGASKVKN
jgi:hypothetical protein